MPHHEAKLPSLKEGTPKPGRRVAQILPLYEGTDVLHAVYLPSDWEPGRRYPVIVEYAPNADPADPTGGVEGACLGYALSGGRGHIWLTLPCVARRDARNEPQWWGDLGATVDYCRQAVRDVCEELGGDPGAVVLAGAGRGAVACSYIGLHDDDIADTWLAFLSVGEFDGLCGGAWPGADIDAAHRRLQRVHGRAFLVCQQGDVPAQTFVEMSGVNTTSFTFRALDAVAPVETWALSETPSCQDLRGWLQGVLVKRPGVYTVSGRVLTQQDRPLANVRVACGYTHVARTDRNGAFSLPGLLPGRRTVIAIPDEDSDASYSRVINLTDHDISAVDLWVE